jgi:tRNA G18 (ribose-2'-O)-methylase SpoU
VKYLILENIRSAYNVGAMFRTADGAGVTKIFLVGYTPTPIDRFGRVQSEIEKTSLGASAEIDWEQADDIGIVIKKLQQSNIQIVVIEQTDHSMQLPDFQPSKQVAYILGNEVQGVSQQAVAQADTVVEIPMLGRKESLNVSVAAGIILYHALNSK